MLSKINLPISKISNVQFLYHYYESHCFDWYLLNKEIAMFLHWPKLYFLTFLLTSLLYSYISVWSYAIERFVLSSSPPFLSFFTDNKRIYQLGLCSHLKLFRIFQDLFQFMNLSFFDTFEILTFTGISMPVKNEHFIYLLHKIILTFLTDLIFILFFI